MATVTTDLNGKTEVIIAADEFKNLENGARYLDKAVISDRNLVTSRVRRGLPEFSGAMIEVFRKPQLLQAPLPR